MRKLGQAGDGNVLHNSVTRFVLSTTPTQLKIPTSESMGGELSAMLGLLHSTS